MMSDQARGISREVNTSLVRAGVSSGANAANLKASFRLHFLHLMQLSALCNIAWFRGACIMRTQSAFCHSMHASLHASEDALPFQSRQMALS
jgi:hypothetical protein